MGPKECVTSLTMVLNLKRTLPDIMLLRADNNSLNMITQLLTWRTLRKSRCFIRSKSIHTVPRVKLQVWMHIGRLKIYSPTETICKEVSSRRLVNRIPKLQTTTSLVLHSIRVSVIIQMGPTLILATRLEILPHQTSYRTMLITVSLPLQRWSHSTLRNCCLATVLHLIQLL